MAAAIFCTLEKHLFDETTPRAEVATSFALQLPSSTSLSQVLITRAARMHTKENERQQTQPVLAQRFKRQKLLRLKHPLHRARHHTKTHKHRKYPANLNQITLNLGPYHQKTHCPQAVWIPFLTSHLNNLCSVSQ